MKRICLLLCLFLTVVLSLFSCEAPETTGTGTTDTTAAVTTPDLTTPQASTPVTTTAPVPKEVLEEAANYTAVLNTEKWTSGDAIDYSQFTNFGSGSTLVNEINVKYNGYKKTYTTTNADGTVTTLSSMEVKKLDVLGAKVTANETEKTVTVALTPITLRVQPTWKSVTAKAGSYLMFDFYTNCNVGFLMTVTATEGGSAQNAAYTQSGVTVTKSGDKFAGVAKCTVPYVPGKTYYINICLDNTAKSVVASIPVTITEAKYDSPYSLIFQGDWEVIRHEDYLDNLIELFYNVYPRLYARFADGSEPKTITFMADKTYDGVAYCAGTVVCVSTTYANANPTDIGFFAHEITHSVQQYGGKMYYGDGAWWTEFMADLGRFRYFHWGYSTEYVKFYSMDDKSIRDFGWQPYGQHNIFASYLDARYPTVQNEDGSIVYGLVDSINRMIKASNTELSDDPYKVGTPFNNMVKAVTGFETMEALRLHFVEELDAGTYVFTGFRDYADNFQTEGIEGVPDPTYPMLEEVKKGDKTATMLTTPVTEGTNLALNVKVVAYSGDQTANPIANAFDGNLDTRWQSKKGSDGDKKYDLGGYEHEFVIDLGEVKSFNTYTLVSAGYKNTDTFNTREWEVFVSSDGENWTSVDYQNEINQDIASFNIGEQSARYVKLRLFRSDRSNVGMARIQEFMLFDVK